MYKTISTLIDRPPDSGEWGRSTVDEQLNLNQICVAR